MLSVDGAAAQCLIRSLCVALLCGWCLPKKTIAADAQRPSVQSIIEGLKRADDAFFESRRLTLRYACIETADLVATEWGTRRAEWLLGRDGGGWCTEARELQPGMQGNVTIPAEPNISILKNGRFLDWRQHNRNVFLGPKKTRNFNVLHGWRYLENAGLNPYRPVIESTGMSYQEATALEKSMLQQFLSAPLLPDFLEQNAENYTVAEQPEPIDGEVCWAIEWPGMDKIWVNVDRGHTVRRRAYHWKPQGPLARQVDNSDFRQVKPGLWFCFRQTVTMYGRLDGDEAYWGKAVNRSTYEVSEFDFSRPPEALTNLRVPAGSFVTDVLRNLQYKVFEEGDPLEKPLGAALQWGELHKPPTAATARPINLLGPTTVAGAALLVLAVLLLFLRRGKAGARRCGLQFSLRGFLIAVTVGCTWLGWNVERARRRGRAIDAISATGGMVLYDYYEDFLNKMQNRLPLHFWSDIRGIPVHVYVFDEPFNPGLVAHLSAVGAITRLRVAHKCSAPEFERLGRLGNCGEIVFTKGAADGELRRLQQRLPKTRIGLEQRDGSIKWQRAG